MYKQEPIVIERDALHYKTIVKYAFTIDDLALDLGDKREIIRAIVNNFEKELTGALKERIERNK